MVKVKNVVLAAVVGFILSFMISLFCTWGFGISFLRGIIFAAVFALLALVIDFVYSKFLDVGTSDFSSDTAKSDSQKLGGKVDISIDDADLTDDGQGLSFAVNNNRQGLWNKESLSLSSSSRNDLLQTSAPISNSSTPVQKETESSAVVSSNVAAKSSITSQSGNAVQNASNVTSATESLDSKSSTPKPDSQQGFQPISLGTPLGAQVSNSASSGASKKAEDRESVNALSDLDLIEDKVKTTSSLKNDEVEDTDFVEEKNISPETPYQPAKNPGKADNKASEHDAETLAKAIQTVLKRED